ncbi:hypothetical protein SCHPADRAFT_827504 [Schizopora paradoxa]|uniref:G-protein coupled receptors family 1 profile domain-containing protein n=1 Tax=Schizopora paradoxa TaxID=27342 RepID=A0A0H2RWF5_9AGAM|nr:hypothetical protein SCHPADRAFT_827504 [Schizopora paradoxa]
MYKRLHFGALDTELYPITSMTLPSHVTAIPAIDLGSRRETILLGYYCCIIIGGQVGLPLVLVTSLLGSQPRRHPTFLNILLAWFLYAVSSLLLFYSGNGISENQRPTFSLCLGQAALVYGGTVLVATTNMALVFQLWMEFKGNRFAKNSPLMLSFVRSNSCILPTYILIAVQLLGLPWLSFLGFLVFTLDLGIHDPSLVSVQWVFYCTISSGKLINSVSGVTIICLAVIFFFQVSIVRMLYQSSRQMRAVNQSSYNLLVRVTAFTGYSLVTFVVSIVLTFRPTEVFPYMFTGTLPLAAFLVFGTQPENLRVWCKYCLRRRRRATGVQLEPITFKPGRFSATSPRSSNTTQFQSSLEKRLPPTPISGSELA